MGKSIKMNSLGGIGLIGSLAPSSSFASAPNGGLVVPPDVTTAVHRDLIVALAARLRMPAVYYSRLFVAAGGLMSYGVDLVDMNRQAAPYVDRILRGDNPADLPVQAATKFENAAIPRPVIAPSSPC